MLSSQSSLVMYDEEYPEKIISLIDRLLRESNAKVIFLVDKDGHDCCHRRNGKSRYHQPCLSDSGKYRSDRWARQTDWRKGILDPVS